MYSLIIIDDEKEISTGFATYFPWSQIGFFVVKTFRNGREALDYLKENRVDVIVTDIIMPVMTGIELAKELDSLELDMKPKIIFFSAYNDFEYAQKALEYGGSKYILKSTSYDELIQIFTNIKNKLDKERAQHEADDIKINNIPEENCKEDNDKIISIIKNYIDSNLKDATLEDAAALVYMSPSYVSKYFKSKTGITFLDYLIECRMRKAGQLLQDIQYKIYEISLMIGYTNAFNFTRSFKKYYGLTPKEYRHKNLNA